MPAPSPPMNHALSLARKGEWDRARAAFVTLIQEDESPFNQVDHRFLWGLELYELCASACDSALRREATHHLFQVDQFAVDPRYRACAGSLLKDLEVERDAGPKWLSVGALTLGGIAFGVASYSAYRWSDFEAELDRGVETSHNIDERDTYQRLTIGSAGLGAGLLAFAIIYEIVSENGHWGRW